MQVDFEFDVAHPEIILSATSSALALRFQTVDQPPSGPQLSGKYIHLTMTLGQAMYLLARLQAVQQHTGVSIPTIEGESIFIPPARSRN
jgi:hypothetical protein